MKKKVLCVCQRGNVRSVGMAWMLKDNYGQDAVAIGWECAGGALKAYLFLWADVIVVMERYMVDRIPEPYREKVLVCDVGPDRYGQFRHPDLVRQTGDFVDKNRGRLVAS